MKRDTTGVRRVRRKRGNRRTGKQGSRAPRPSVSPRLRAVASAVVAIAAFVGAGVGMHYGWEALCQSSRLRVRAIDTKGNRRVSPQELQTYTGIETGDPILKTDLDNAAIGLRRHPWVAQATVHRGLPDRITVEVVEHEARVIVALGELYLANDAGILFKRLSPSDGLVLPVVTGIDRADAARQDEEVAFRVREAITLARAVASDGVGLGRLDELHWDRDLGWSIVTRPSLQAAPLTLHLGRRPSTRIPLVVRGLARLRELKKEPSVLWADGRENPGRVHVQLRRATTVDHVGSSTAADETLLATAR